MAEKLQNADSREEIKEEKNNTTTEQQKGLPTLLADLNERKKDRNVYIELIKYKL